MPIAAASVIPAARLRECLIALPFLRRPVPCWTTPERLYSRHDAADIPDGSDDGSGGGDLDYRAEAGGGPRHPRPGDRAGLPPAGWAGAAGGGAGAARGDAGPRLPAPGSGLSRPVAGRAAALRRRERLGSARRRAPGVAPLRSLLRDLRLRPRPRHRAAAPRRNRAGVAAGNARRAARIPDRLRALELRHRPRLRAARPPHRHGAPLPPARPCRAGVRIHRRPWAGAARSPMAPGGAPVREARIPSHPRRPGPPALRPLPGDPGPENPATGGGGHLLHGGPLGHPDRLDARARAEGALVSAAHRGADRALDRLHGVREHRRGPPGAPLALGVRIRAGARLRLLVLSPRCAPVRRRPPRHLAPVVQRGGGAGTGGGGRRGGAGARGALPAGDTRADGRDPGLGAGCSYRVALDARPRVGAQAVPVSVAGARRGSPRRGDARADAGAHRGRGRVVDGGPGAAAGPSGGARAGGRGAVMRVLGVAVVIASAAGGAVIARPEGPWQSPARTVIARAAGPKQPPDSTRSP